MKKLLVLILCLGLSVMAVGCQPEKEESTEWIKESASKIEKEITSGQFALDGVVYEFPMDLQQWLDNGWRLSNNYENIEGFTLEPGASSSAFELFDKDDNYVRVSALNTSSEEAKLEDCMVNYLYMSLSEVDIVLPQGLTKRNKPADVLSAYGEPVSEGDESGLLEALYYYESDDAYQCYVELDVIDNDYTTYPFSSVEYSITSPDSMWDALVESEGVEAAYEYFLDAVLKTSYWGDYEDYVDLSIDSKSGATELYESEMNYYAECLMYYADVNVDYLSEEQADTFVQIAKDVLAKVKWNIKEIEVDVFDEGTVVLEIYPTDFFYLIDNDIANVIDQFNEKYADADFEAMPDEEYAVVEQEYAAGILEVMEGKVSEAGTLEAVEKEYELGTETELVSDEAWAEIDDIIMDVLE